MSIDPKFVELTADVLKISVYKMYNIRGLLQTQATLRSLYQAGSTLVTHLY